MPERKVNLPVHTSIENKKSQLKTAQSQGVDLTPCSLFTGRVVNASSIYVATQVAVVAAIVDKPDETGIDQPKHC